MTTLNEELKEHVSKLRRHLNNRESLKAAEELNRLDDAIDTLSSQAAISGEAVAEFVSNENIGTVRWLLHQGDALQTGDKLYALNPTTKKLLAEQEDVWVRRCNATAKERDALKLQLSQRQQWLPIETAPKDGTFLLATGWDKNEIGGVRHYAIVQHSNYGDIFHTEVGDEYGYLTHWMPLQPAPIDSGPLEDGKQ